MGQDELPSAGVAGKEGGLKGCGMILLGRSLRVLWGKCAVVDQKIRFLGQLLCLWTWRGVQAIGDLYAPPGGTQNLARRYGAPVREDDLFAALKASEQRALRHVQLLCSLYEEPPGTVFLQERVAERGYPMAKRAA